MGSSGNCPVSPKLVPVSLNLAEYGWVSHRIWSRGLAHRDPVSLNLVPAVPCQSIVLDPGL